MKRLSSLGMLLTPLAVFAHAGHVDGTAASTGLMHYLTSPLHMIPLTLAVVVGGFLVRRRVVAARSRKQ